MDTDRMDAGLLLRLTAGAFALALAAAWGSAHAVTSSTHSSAAPTAARRMAACKQLPGSQQDICRQEAGFGKPAMPKQSSAQVAQENARYQKASNTCKRLPVSERTTCMSRAGADTTLASAH